MSSSQRVVGGAIVEEYIPQQSNVLQAGLSVEVAGACPARLCCGFHESNALEEGRESRSKGQ